jgi:hypothetical protein
MEPVKPDTHTQLYVVLAPVMLLFTGTSVEPYLQSVAVDITTLTQTHANVQLFTVQYSDFARI